MGIPFCLETRAAPLSEVKMINVLLAIPSWLISCMISPKTKKIVEEGYLRTEVMGDFNIHGTKYFQDAVFHQHVVSLCTFGWASWVCTLMLWQQNSILFFTFIQIGSGHTMLFFRQGRDGRTLLVQPSRIPCWISKNSFCFGFL